MRPRSAARASSGRTCAQPTSLPSSVAASISQSGLTDGVRPVDDAGELLDQNLITGLVGGKELDLSLRHEGRGSAHAMDAG
jgi:hypothetical protein